VGASDSGLSNPSQEPNLDLHRLNRVLTALAFPIVPVNNTIAYVFMDRPVVSYFADIALCYQHTIFPTPYITVDRHS